MVIHQGINAKDVIKIGRPKRIFAASIAASTTFIPRLVSANLSILDNQNRIFRSQANQRLRDRSAYKYHFTKEISACEVQ